MGNVYVWASGQSDNLGDSVLRRALLDTLRPVGPLTVYVGSTTSAYRSGLRLRPSDEVETSGMAWLWQIVHRGGRQPVVALNAGELQLTQHYLPLHLLWIAALLAARIRGGSGLLLGAGIREDNRRWRWALVAAGSLCRMVRWRDPHTADSLLIGAVMPDWGFLSGPGVPDVAPLDARSTLVVSMRGDRPAPSDEWCGEVLALALRLDLQVTVVSQVVRDDGRTTELAARLGATAHPWGGGPHRDREIVIRAHHRHARVVLSDRMHGLVIGLTEGAVPIALVDTAAPKIARAFAVLEAVPTPVVVVGSDGTTAARLDALVAARPQFIAALATAQSAVSRLQDEVLTVTRARRPRPVRVLHSLHAPDGTTRFVDQMVGGAPAGLQVQTFSWWRAITGRYDVFHVHWPEFLLRHRLLPVRAAKHGFCLVLLARLRLARTPIVRTLHNLEPHESGGRLESAIAAHLDRRTDLKIRLNPTTPVPEGRSVTILHGHYRDRFSRFDQPARTPGRLLTIGLIRPYKGVEGLLDAFREVDATGLTLRIVGKPQGNAIRTAVAARAAQDARVSTRLEFVPDEALVAEVSGAELVVLPYVGMHNSGAALVALSLRRPVLVPDGAATRALAEEVGGAWVQRFDGTLRAEHLERALARVRAPDHGGEPQLAGRDWSAVGEQHLAAYRSVLRARDAS